MSFCAPPNRSTKLLFYNVRKLVFCVLLHVLSIITRKYLTQHDIKEKPGCSCLACYLQNIKCCRSQIYVSEGFLRPTFRYSLGCAVDIPSSGKSGKLIESHHTHTDFTNKPSFKQNFKHDKIS